MSDVMLKVIPAPCPDVAPLQVRLLDNQSQSFSSNLPLDERRDGFILVSKPAFVKSKVKPPSASAMSNSTRSIPKATYVSLKEVHSDIQSNTGRAVLKFGFIRQLGLQKGEVDAVLAPSPSPSGGKAASTPQDSSLAAILRLFEGTPLSSTLPSPAVFAEIPTTQLVTFGKGLAKVRQYQFDNLPTGITDSGILINLLNISIAATNAFNANTSIPPVGWLNLERLEMTPAGIEQGELLATVALAPMEKTAVVQQEWSVISQEFTSIVTDSLENFSQTGVTENTELAQATTSQNAHSNQFNITTSASGGCGFVSGSVNASFGAQDQNSASAADSRKHAMATTHNASSRVKQSRKVTISTSSSSGSSQTTTRTMENPSATDPMRIDYFSMMRKWHVGLYRYGLRLTYDLAVPEPGAAMRETYQKLDDLTTELNKTFSFPVNYSDINELNYLTLASQYGAQISLPPPKATLLQQVGGPIPNLPSDEKDEALHPGQIQFTVPDGYEIDSVSLDLNLGHYGSSRDLWIVGTNNQAMLGPSDFNKSFNLVTGAGSNFLQGMQGTVTIAFMAQYFATGTMSFTFNLKRTDQVFEQWVASVWSALYDAAQTSFLSNQQRVQAEINALQGKISGIDTLTLRREENDEIMKCVLRWLFGTNFEFVPDSVIALFSAAGGDLTHGVNFTGNSLGPNTQNWSIMYQYEAMVNFINQAIEWENVIYFLYSYFWDVPQSWDFIRQIQHPDPTRQAFLRAGSARVVLTVRRGFETAWTWFAEHGDLNTPPTIPLNDPYMTIAQQIENYDSTNYPGIPPANASGPVGDSPQVGTSAADDIAPGATATTPVMIPVANSTGFAVGAVAIIDSWDSGIQETQAITAVPDSTHVTVQGLLHAHSVGNGAYPVVQASSRGLLIAEWFEYTPSQGTLIAVNSDLTTIV